MEEEPDGEEEDYYEGEELEAEIYGEPEYENS